MADHPDVLLTTSRFRVERRQQKLSDGQTLERQIVVHPGAVTIIPVLPDERICLIRNYRVAVGEILIELPAGTLDAGEEPIETARRELVEETGYRAEMLELLCEFYMSPGILSERMTVFMATGLRSGKVALEAGEQIEPMIVTLDEAIALVNSGEIRDAKTIAALLYYERFGNPAARRIG